VALAALTATCANRVVAPPAPGPLTEPRASWLIKFESPSGRQTILCRSDASGDCVLRASTPDRPVTAVVTVFLYPAGEKTVYRGAFMSGFIGGKEHETQVDYTIESGKRPIGISSVGLVTQLPGTYQFRMALFAEVPGHTDPHQFAKTIPVRVQTATEVATR